ncbi:putative phenylalanine ammonia-lyase [Talaromyces proteolyticus]|uniref:Phenylalanine ammonia-lyase n=1 Tax=Talaromyces proteolyticus TaxID=1131652 RepID=A0AAD4Q1J7_9EURO|nr:putative phenylalanine ammonia-lyase [Talaromyces proteolyticus]KAH8698789.1 putative phenylalanine ammonia-lyase [Talaromyces proteolyticus]
MRSQHLSIAQFARSDTRVVVDGNSLSIAGVVAVSLHGKHALLTDDSEILDCVQQSVDFLNQELSNGRTVYGVTTGFGGSADTRTSKLESLQDALQQHLNVGVLLPSDKGLLTATATEPDGLLRSHALPASIVKAMMLVRCNSLIRGHSGVRLSIVENILTMLNKKMTPVVPLRGSISASGDLSPLSYIAGMLEGNPDVFIRVGDTHPPTYLPADKALAKAGIQAVRLQAKEGLGIMNGTATSCAAGCIAIYQAGQLAVVIQLLTAMGTEALLGTIHNYHPFISEARPHVGQAEAAANITAFLSGSKLARDKNVENIGLAQDRYSLRTASQWIGPSMEDLDLAHRQVQVEVNSTTDNPLIDITNAAIHHGGNFQATSITSAMEKTTSAMQMFGKLIFAQSSEVIDNKLNKGLPPNLSADDPSLSFTCKGVDVNMAAYMSELAYVNHPVSSHVQSTEMHNQSVNSLALVAARYALESVEILSLMVSTYIYVLCQALDLRCLHLEFVKAAQPALRKLLLENFSGFVGEGSFDSFEEQTWVTLQDNWSSLSHLDLADRGTTAVKSSIGHVLQDLMLNHKKTDIASHLDLLSAIDTYQNTAGRLLSSIYNSTREDFFKTQTTTSYLSPASAKLYSFVRHQLKVPFHRGLQDHPLLFGTDEELGRRREILGTMVSHIYLAVRKGDVYDIAMEALREAIKRDKPYCNGSA